MRKIAVGILAHVDAGKTTLAEALLFNSGTIRRIGRVDHRDTALDTHELEKDRGITIFAGEASFTVGDTEFTLLDTPGHVDFSAETERVLRVLDCAILVISGSDGVQAHTRTVWKLLEYYAVPTFVFVTKCDMGRRGRADILSELEGELGSVVDFSRDGVSFADAEKIAMCSDELLDEYLSGGALSDESIRSAICSRRMFPCFFGSGLKNDGVGELAAGLERYAVSRDWQSDFGARVYKIVHDGNERITKLRVTGGTLRVRDVIEYGGISEKVNQIRIYTGAKYVTVDEASAGTVCAVTGLTKTASGQGLGTDEDASASVLEPVIRYRIVLPDGADPRIVLPKLKSLEEEDPKLHITYDERLGEFHCALMGKVQAEIFRAIVADRFGLDIEIAGGKVIYKETVTDTVEGVGHYEPLRHYAEVHLLIEPLTRGSGVVLSTRCSETQLDRNWQRLILTHLAEKTHVGVLTGSPITDVKISLMSGRAHLKHTEGGDFRQATYRAVRQGLMHAQSVLLEPFYSFRLDVPANLIGRAISDVRLMGGSFDAPVNDGEYAILRGKAPVVTMDGYMTEVASYTSGLGRLSLALAGYDLCHDADEVIKSAAYEAERDLANPADSVFCAHGAGFNVKWSEVKNYMHLGSCLEKKSGGEKTHRHISIDEAELEAIMLREFGPVKRELYREPRSVGKEEKSGDVGEIKPKCLIVDGYNVIFAWDSLKEIAENDLEGARLRLANILANYSHFTGVRVVLVFDGYLVKGNHGEKLDHHGIDVVYTKENETGDAYIEKLIAQIGKNEQVRVVTSDGLIQLSTWRVGVLRMSSTEFEAEIEKVDGQIAELIEKESAK